MSPHEHTSYDTKRVGKGYRKFNGELYQFWYKATMKGRDFSNDFSRKHEQEVQIKAETLREQGYQVRVITTRNAEFLFYVRGERTQ